MAATATSSADMGPLSNDRARLGAWSPQRPDGLGDDVLLAAMAAGDVRAGSAFVRRHERRVFAIALSITSNRATAEDVAQEAFLRVWRHAAIFDRRRTSAVGWLSTITHNLAIDTLRLQRAVPVDPNDAMTWLDAPDGRRAPEDQAVHSEAIDRIRGALAELPVEQRRALVRAAYFGESAAEVAEGEQIALGTAKSRIRLALAKVRSRLADPEEEA